MAPRETFLLFTCISFTFTPLIPIYKQNYLEDKKKCQNSSTLFQNCSLLPKYTAPETHIGPKQ